MGIIGVGQEPSNHALQDIAKVKERMEQWGRLLLLLFESVQDFAKFNTSDYGQLPTTVQYAVDPDGRIKAQICKEMRMKNEQQLPIFIVADTFNRIVFSTQGYTIGLGEQLAGTVAKLK